MASKLVPFRLAIQMALTQRLEQIVYTDTNGKQTPMAGRVYRGRNKLGEDQPTPTLAILESPQQLDLSSIPPQGPVAADSWELLLKGDVSDNKTHPTDNAHWLMAEVKRVLNAAAKEFSGPNIEIGSSNILGMGGKVMELSFSGGIVRPAEENISPCSFFWLPITLRLAEDRDNPYWTVEV